MSIYQQSPTLVSPSLGPTIIGDYELLKNLFLARGFEILREGRGVTGDPYFEVYDANRDITFWFHPDGMLKSIDT